MEDVVLPVENIDNDATLAVEAVLSPEVFLKTYYKADRNVCLGVSLLGRKHKEMEVVCQDYHLFSDLGEGWELYAVSDGAGSAKAADRGARWNCIITEYLIKGMLERNDWKQRDALPSELEWYQEFVMVCRMVKSTIADRVEMLDEPIVSKDCNATLLVVMVTPKGILAGHIGDGRMGYKDLQGHWHSMMVPHKGQEANQTIFMMNQWDAISIPTLRMNNVSVPEVRVISEVPQAVVLLSDGCENFCWNCLQKNDETGMLEDRNSPFEGFWNPLLAVLAETPDETLDAFINFVDHGSEECEKEQDDRTLMLGLYNYDNYENQDTTSQPG